VKSRVVLAEKTLKQFEEAPLTGQGFGTTIFWPDGQSHNAYLDFADCGILGVLVIPWLILSIRRADWSLYLRVDILALAFFYHDVCSTSSQ